MSKPWRSKAYLSAARDQPCSFCGVSDGTVVAAHIRLSGFCGTGQKPSDIMTVDACQNCHDKLDGRQQPNWQNDWQQVLRALCKTLNRRLEQGVLRDG